MAENYKNYVKVEKQSQVSCTNISWSCNPIGRHIILKFVGF